MEFLNAVGSRRSIRWFRPWQAVEPEKVQRVLEAARLAPCPGNLQPWRAVVVRQAELDPGDRARLLEAGNAQRPHEQAPVWIYWFGDASAITPQAFLAQVTARPRGRHALPLARGGTRRPRRGAIEDGTPAPLGHGPAPPDGPRPARRRSRPGWRRRRRSGRSRSPRWRRGRGARHVPPDPGGAGSAATLFEVLGVPAHFVPVWLQLLGYPAEPRGPAGTAARRLRVAVRRGALGAAPARDAARGRGSRAGGPDPGAAPLPGRAEELAALARMFGYPAA